MLGRLRWKQFIILNISLTPITFFFQCTSNKVYVLFGFRQDSIGLIQDLNKFWSIYFARWGQRKWVDEHNSTVQLAFVRKSACNTSVYFVYRANCKYSNVTKQTRTQDIFFKQKNIFIIWVLTNQNKSYSLVSHASKLCF